jgi:hypothetical protein
MIREVVLCKYMSFASAMARLVHVSCAPFMMRDSLNGASKVRNEKKGRIVGKGHVAVQRIHVHECLYAGCGGDHQAEAPSSFSKGEEQPLCAL